MPFLIDKNVILLKLNSLAMHFDLDLNGFMQVIIINKKLLIVVHCHYRIQIGPNY